MPLWFIFIPCIFPTEGNGMKLQPEGWELHVALDITWGYVVGVAVAILSVCVCVSVHMCTDMQVTAEKIQQQLVWWNQN